MRKALNKTARIDDLIHRRVGAELHDGPAQLMTLALVRLDEIKDILHAFNTSSRVVHAAQVVFSARSSSMLVAMAGLKAALHRAQIS
jgi:signal transduction histidine kinase